jgi:FlaA1/EpsC-like NDP-sugar epimerase
LRAVFAQHRPEIVFHAAAHKHVPLMENSACEAVTNNVLGTQRLVEAAAAAEVEHFVLISTDKAINPSSVMGATKRVAEMVVQDAARRTGRSYVSVRFGNVLGSRGSVVPLFKKQIAAGGPVTVTHPEMRRYFMTIPEAVQLVLQAGALGQGGAVFVLDMGQPVRIVDLASDLIRLSGLEPGRDIEIKFTGMRPGEKLFEEIFADDEAYTRTTHEKILMCADSSPGDGARSEGQALAGGRRKAIAALITAAQAGEEQEARRLLHVLLPEYGEDQTLLADEVGAVTPAPQKNAARGLSGLTGATPEL